MTKEGKATLEQMYEQFRTNHNDDRADALYEALKEIETFEAMKELSSAQPKIKPIEYLECVKAILRMWMDNVVTTGEYNRIMDRLNAHWGMED